jgi:FkbM family methyltransferase
VLCREGPHQRRSAHRRDLPTSMKQETQLPFVSYAQNFEDVMLRRALAGVDAGFYIDVGAQDPVADSVTRTFYESGWRGINIEPVAEWIVKLRRDRPRDINIQAAAGNENGEVWFYEVVGNGLSTTSEETARRHAETGLWEIREYAVAMRRLSDVCLEHDVHEVHFMKVDVEGAERSVLEGLDLAAVRPWIVLVEATLPNTTIDLSETWEQLLTGRGYHHVWYDGLNRFYVADERAHLDTAFLTPPNIWDAFEMPLERRAAELEVEAESLRNRLAATEERLAATEERLAVTEERLAACDNQRQSWQGEAEGWRARTERAEKELTTVYGTWSWRLTTPLRLASRTLRAILRGPT